MAEKILVVDDEKEIADLLEVYLKNDGYTVYKFYNGADALKCVEETELDLAVLDIMLPDIDGLKLCQKIRENFYYPVIMLTAKIADGDKITGLTVGADDYITKPFNPLEVVARIKTQLRRYTRYNKLAPKKETEAQEYDIRGLFIRKDNHKCLLFGKELQLTPIEFSILWYLCERQGVVVPSEELFEAVWGEKYFQNNNTVMAHIGRLREKMKENARHPKFIKTVWGGSDIPLKNRKEDSSKGAIRKEFHQLRTKIFVRTVGMFLTAMLFFYFVYRCFLYGKFAKWMITVFEYVLLMDYDMAYDFYQHTFRNYAEWFILLFIVLVFFVLLRIYLGWFTRYFEEISGRMDVLTGKQDGEISLSQELYPIERKMTQLQYTMEKQKSDMLASEQRKNDLVMYLAHDLKTPLASVIGYLNLLRDEGQISEELREKYLSISLDKAERLEELINEFFEIARYNLSDITLRCSRINFSRLLEQLAYEFEPMLREKELTLALDVGEDIMLSCDADKLQRVFDNLLRNAVLYSFRGTEIVITAESQKYALIVKVRNHGETLPEEALERLFEQFYRLDAARSTDSGCAGLGLAIAKQIVELHNGTITARSEENLIEFTVTLPLSREEHS